MANWFTRKLNGSGGDPVALADSLADLNAKRTEARRTIGELNEQRSQALRDQDFKLAEKLYRERRAAEALLEGLDLSEPELRERLAAAQGAARRAEAQRARQEFATLFDPWADRLLKLATDARELVAYADRMPDAARDGAVKGAALLLAFVSGWALERRSSLDTARAALTGSHAVKSARVAPPAPALAKKLQPDERPPTSLQHGVRNPIPGIDSPVQNLTAKPVADDMTPLEPGQARVLTLVAGFSWRDDKSALRAGIRTILPIAAAQQQAKLGRCEILEVAVDRSAVTGASWDESANPPKLGEPLAPRTIDPRTGNVA